MNIWINSDSNPDALTVLTADAAAIWENGICRRHLQRPSILTYLVVAIQSTDRYATTDSPKALSATGVPFFLFQPLVHARTTTEFCRKRCQEEFIYTMKVN
jgi:hypothetical protein